MFSFKVKLAIALYIFMILSIPVGAYLASQNQSKNTKTSANEEIKPINQPITKPITKEATSSGKQTASFLEEINNLANPTAEPSASPTTTATSFGPTLNIKLVLEGRPADKQTSKVFVGITNANPGQNPQYLLSFTIDLPDSGIFKGVSLAGLNTGSQYAAVVKPTAQIAKTINFTMLPSETELNNGKTITLVTGDLNEDNVINSADYAISKALLGTTSKSSNWNEVADFNKDGVVNIADLGYIVKNFSESGDSGVWGSTPPKEATSSGSLLPTADLIPASDSGIIKHPAGNSEGYWIWVPKEAGL